MKSNLLGIARSLGVLALALAGLGTTGCVKHVYAINMANPTKTGNVEPNRVEARQRRLEKRHALPSRTLSNVASITALDNQRICFDVELKSIAPNHRDIDPAKWNMGIFGEPEFQNDSGRVERVDDSSSQDFQGRVEVVTTKNKRVCTTDKQGKETCRNRQTTTRTLQPGTVTVLSRKMNVCFINENDVNPNTQFISLKFHRKGSVARRIFWQWDFQ